MWWVHRTWFTALLLHAPPEVRGLLIKSRSIVLNTIRYRHDAALMLCWLNIMGRYCLQPNHQLVTSYIQLQYGTMHQTPCPVAVALPTPHRRRDSSLGQRQHVHARHCVSRRVCSVGPTRRSRKVCARMWHAGTRCGGMRCSNQDRLKHGGLRG